MVTSQIILKNDDQNLMGINLILTSNIGEIISPKICLTNKCRNIQVMHNHILNFGL